MINHERGLLFIVKDHHGINESNDRCNSYIKTYCFFITGIYPTEKEGDDEGLSTGVKIAIGVGVGVGVLVIIVIAILCYCCICKRRG